MKKMTTIAIAFALTLMVAGFAVAGSNMNHGDMKMDGKAASMHDGMKMMKKNLDMMKMDVEMMKKEPANRKKHMGSMNKHMTEMHHGMEAVKGHAKKNHDKGMQNAMSQMDKDMMMLMKGMGKTKKDPNAGIPMMEDSLMKMEKNMMKMKKMM
tara:strand:- start:15942 stop:16400 length:459 start_codon:yes stop_codon:yes gene_type:complete